MSLFLSTATMDRVTDITPGIIREMGASMIILDVDNTLATHGSPAPLVRTVEWARVMWRVGLAVVIISNNFRDQVTPFTERYDLPFLCVAMKPLSFAYQRAVRFLGVSHSQAVAVGDQVFTGVIGTSVAGVKSILLRPSDPETSVSFRVRRRPEEPIRRKMERRRVEREKTDRNGEAWAEKGYWCYWDLT